MKASRTQVIFALLFINISILLSAYYIQYVLKVPPCPMCQYQRIPYYLAVVVLGVFFFNIMDFKKLILTPCLKKDSPRSILVVISLEKK